MKSRGVVLNYSKMIVNDVIYANVGCSKARSSRSWLLYFWLQNGGGGKNKEHDFALIMTLEVPSLSSRRTSSYFMYFNPTQSDLSLIIPPFSICIRMQRWGGGGEMEVILQLLMTTFDKSFHKKKQKKNDNKYQTLMKQSIDRITICK